MKRHAKNIFKYGHFMHFCFKGKMVVHIETEIESSANNNKIKIKTHFW